MMKTKHFTLFSVALAAAGFFAGFMAGGGAALKRSGLLEEEVSRRVRRSVYSFDRIKAENALYVLQSLDEGKSEEARARLNTQIAFWIANESAHARKGSWIQPSMQPSQDTSLLADIARHREKYPVLYDDPMIAELMSNALSTAVLVEEKRNNVIWAQE